MTADRTLANGLRVLAIKHGRAPVAEARLILPAPCRTRETLAESVLLAACLSRGRVAEHGMELDVAADVHQLTATLSGPLDDLDTLVRGLADVARGVPAEVDAARGQLVARLALLRANPDLAMRAELARHLFGGHPVAFPMPGDDELAAIAEPRHRPAGPRGAVLVILAPDDPDRLADACERAFEGWQDASPLPPLPPLPGIGRGRLLPLPTPGAPQSRIRLRAPGVTVADERYPALFLARDILGGSLSSRLSRSLREDKGYVYGVTAFFDHHPGAGFLSIEADTATATTRPALDVLFAELDRMRTHPPTADEIEAARAYALGSAAVRLAPAVKLAGALAGLAAKAVDPLLLLGFPRRLAAVTPESVVEAAGRFFAPGSFSGVVAADPGELTGLR
ncbi:insulinase family protein [Actinomadura sp. ATCC 31491]|uniref:Insulinase family protein n=1 Tax=Actinomadura luzonensis TaxID=2805427 RepID=A0ABT0FMZ3_9ACTN|nr:insulinase family protein [Actinomadura luzonensis]MCK2213717.1 insulinase family protein [Actinomadura luzonensis]